MYEFDLNLLIQFVVAIVLGFGGVEGAKQGVRWAKRRNSNSSFTPNEFDYIEPTNPTAELPMTRTECQLRHANLSSEMSNIKDTLVEIKKDTKQMLKIQLEVSDLKGDFSTQLSEIKGDIPKKINDAIDKHEDKYHKVA